MSPAMSRRRFLGAGTVALAGAGALAVAGTPFLRELFADGQPGLLLTSRAPVPAAFRAELPIPPVLAPVHTDTTTDFYEIVQRPGKLGILPGLSTEAWTYHGSFPGPTLKTPAGRKAVVKHTNQLPHPTVVHLHGGHTPAESDGYPTDLIHPVGGEQQGSLTGMAAMSGMAGMAKLDSGGGQTSRTYTYPLDQRAATLWYHDHRMGFTAANVWQGLAGFHLVTDDEEAALPLPQGKRDIPLMICDRSFGADGSFTYPALAGGQQLPGVSAAYMDGVLGDVILVNGAPWPVLRADRARYRFRILNGSNARQYSLALDPQPPGGGALVQIGSDGGLLASPRTHDSIDVAPAERFDVVIDFARYAPGTRVRLVNKLGTGGTAEVMCFDVGTDGRVADDSHVPAKLSEIAPLDRASATTTRDFLFQKSSGAWTINGAPYTPGRDLARARLGTTEVWRFTSDVHHPVHLHLNHFQVLSRNGRPPGPYDAGWKDTVDVRPSEAVEVAVKFTGYAGRYMLHCHNLEHEDMAMMADFSTE
ncbi:multicopper oxidase domain-containing protein [Amycolatopsis sp., V23-08]|uniref:Multicopper oxidase CueO n=1 Tax=Amycolatopsis heterodermiae TaxID=3110235 RepID=A0ABU5R322_9PSEU|nr:multicopper oxidase domain-containing protein [Amycolatopsis sp., V23-08]MEA5360600.1 multicopper oxidase domain-containing protein [Amycolatopsis sp., V23-08]